MRKYISVLIVIMLAVLISVACSNEAGVSEAPVNPPNDAQNTPGAGSADPAQPPSSGNNDTTDDGNANDTPVTVPVFYHVLSNVTINLNDNINIVLDSLGEPAGIMVMPSCAFDGDDRVYRFHPGTDLYTYPEGDNDFIHTIAFFDDTIKTVEGGIRLRSPLQAVLDAYGDDYELETDMYRYTRGDTLLEFLITDGVVTGIQYRLAIEIQIG